MKIISIVGARPQFIKVAALQRAVEKKANIEHLILHTAQHYDYNMSEVFFRELDLPKPAFHLNIDDPTAAASIPRMTEGINGVLASEMPTVVIVYGDTNSTLAGAISAKKLNLALAHVEAGLRSHDMWMPEERNRIETDKLADVLFCPTIKAMNNLLEEGFNKQDCKLVLSGDIMLDAINYYRGKLVSITGPQTIAEKFIVCTLHRQNLVQSPEKLTAVVNALNEINRQVPVTMPAHPRFKRVIDALGLPIEFAITPPVGYLDMISLLESCRAVITDSGGLQKEAFFCKKTCITIRNETEWTELVHAGVNFIAGDSSAEQIIATFHAAITAKPDFDHKFYGNGDCADIIIKELTGGNW